jgi:hypothetical protein
MQALSQRRQRHDEGDARALRAAAAVLQVVQRAERAHVLRVGGQRRGGGTHAHAVHVQRDGEAGARRALQARPAVHPPRLQEVHLPQQTLLGVGRQRHRLFLQQRAAQGRRLRSQRVPRAHAEVEQRLLRRQRGRSAAAAAPGLRAGRRRLRRCLLGCRLLRCRPCQCLQRCQLRSLQAGKCVGESGRVASQEPACI